MRAARSTPDAKVLSHLVEGAGLLESTQAVDDGAEKPEQDQRAVLIHVKLTIAGLVALRPHEVQPFDQTL